MFFASIMESSLNHWSYSYCGSAKPNDVGHKLAICLFRSLQITKLSRISPNIQTAGSGKVLRLLICYPTSLQNP